MISTILLWPDAFDFPVFRKNVPTLLKHVDELLICFTKHGNHPIDSWIRQNLKNCRFYDSSVPQALNYSGDWRNQAENLLIDKANGDWILFMEPDFFIKDYQSFFSKIKESMKEYDVIGYEESRRFHPAFLVCKREILERTRRDFTAFQDLDHFGMFTKQLKGFAKMRFLSDLDLLEGRDWFHMGGLTENMFSSKPYYRLGDFYAYNDACLKLDIPMSDYWISEMNRVKSSSVEDADKIKAFL